MTAVSFRCDEFQASSGSIKLIGVHISNVLLEELLLLTVRSRPRRRYRRRHRRLVMSHASFADSTMLSSGIREDK